MNVVGLRFFCAAWAKPVMTLLAVIAIVAGHSPTAAQDNLDNVSPVVDRLTQSYGGKRLRALQSVSIESNRRLAWPGQGHSASLVEFATDRVHKHFDLRNQYGSVERWIHQGGNLYHNRYVMDENGGAQIDYFQGSVARNPDASYFGAFSGDYRMSDLLLAHLLTNNPPEIQYAGTIRYLADDQDILRFRVSPDSPDVEIYVSRTDGLIRRLSFSRPLGEIAIMFRDHKRIKGLTYATEIQVFIDEALVEYETGLQLTPNKSVNRKIAVEDDLTPPPAAPESSNMTVDELAPETFLVGQDDYSLFVRDEDQLFAVNPSAGFKARYEALIDHLGTQVPLALVIITHHHSDHMGDLSEAIELGATLAVTEDTRLAMTQSHDTHDTDSLIVMADEDRIGPFDILIRDTSHAAQNAFVFHPQSGLLFQDDHYHGLISEGPSRIQPPVHRLHAIIEDSGFEVTALLSGHARKAESWVQFDEAVRNDPKIICPRKRKICKGQTLTGATG